jgi:hypothetical protein
LEFVRSVKIKSSFSFAVCLIDSYTGAPALSSEHNVVLTDMTVKPIIKPNGYYVFTDLPIQPYEICVQSKQFIEERTIVSLESINMNDPIIYIPLTPNTLYHFDEETTTIVALLQEESGAPVPSVRVRATVTADECAKAKLAQEIIDKGCTQISLAQMTGKVNIGDRFLLKCPTGNCSEYCRVMTINETTRSFRLEHPLMHTYEKGALLFPVIETLSDHKGETIVFFKYFRVPTFGITLEFKYGNQNVVKELILKPATLLNLGIIRLVN